MISAVIYDVFMLLPTLLKVLDKLVPRLVIAVIAATAIKAAIRPYSIAVAPSSFLNIFFRNFMSGLQFGVQNPGAFCRLKAVLKTINLQILTTSLKLDLLRAVCHLVGNFVPHALRSSRKVTQRSNHSDHD